MIGAVVERQATSSPDGFEPSQRWPYTFTSGAGYALGLTASVAAAAWSLDGGWTWLAAIAGGLATFVYWRASTTYREWSVGPDASATAGQLVWCSVIGVGACAAGAAILEHGSDENSRRLAAIGVAVLVAGLMPVMHAIRSEPPETSDRHWSEVAAGWGLNIGFAYLALLPGLLILGAPLFVAIAVPSAWIVSVAMNRASEAKWYRSLLGLFLGIGVLAMVLFLQLETPGDNVALLVVLLAVAFGMIDAFSAPFRRTRQRYEWSGMRVAIALILAVATVGAVIYLRFVTLAHADWRIAAFVAVAAFLFGGSFIRHGQGITLLVVLASLTLWVVADRNDRAPPGTSTDASGTIVALGDSYASGEGAKAFFPGTNVTGGNDCRRSSNSYGYRSAVALDRRLVFLACSGALGKQVWDTGQIEGSDDAEVVGTRPQLDNEIPGDAPDLVLISIGGNDALFGAIGRGCAVPGSCTEIRDVFDGNLDRVGPIVATSLEYVAMRFRDSPVVVVPYPQMLPTWAAPGSTAPSRKCPGVPLDEPELRYLHTFVRDLTAQVEWGVSEANERVETRAPGTRPERPNLAFFTGATQAYTGHEICNETGRAPGVNVLTLAPTEADGLFDRLVPTNWMHNNFHPNAVGQKLMANALSEWIRANVPGFGNALALEPTQGVDRPAAHRQDPDCTDREACRRKANHWSTGKTIEAARSVFIPVLLLIGLGWALAAISRIGRKGHAR
jgi:lysophospholipase L1-like esterase